MSITLQLWAHFSASWAEGALPITVPGRPAPIPWRTLSRIYRPTLYRTPLHIGTNTRLFFAFRLQLYGNRPLFTSNLSFNCFAAAIPHNYGSAILVIIEAFRTVINRHRAPQQTSRQTNKCLSSQLRCLNWFISLCSSRRVTNSKPITWLVLMQYVNTLMTIGDAVSHGV